MASGQTTNYKLNQWAAEDPVLRTDFNRDNAKLDAALAALQEGENAYPVRRLLALRLEEPAESMELDLSGLDMEEYLELMLYVQLGEGVTAWEVHLRINDVTEYFRENTRKDCIAYVELSDEEPWRTCCQFRVLLGGAVSAASDYTYLEGGEYQTNSTQFRRVAELSAGEVSRLRLVSYPEGSQLGADTRVWLFGLKK